MKTSLDITPSPRLLAILGDIPLHPWQCLAELVDNSLDELLKLPDRSDEDPLLVEIEVSDDGARGTYITVKDNGSGMSEDELERSIRAGHSGKNRYGSLGLFGMGFNIATARLGNVTTVTTTQSGAPESLSTTIDFADIQSRESFSIPLTSASCAPEETGTTVKVHLKREMAEQFRRPAYQQTLMNQLGDVYSYLLRSGVPGLSREDMSSRRPVVLTFNGETVEPKLPCVWADSRSVQSYGQKVNAVQYIDVKLTAATACLDCGYWDRKNGPEECEECGSRHLQLRERRIWGWIGVQRFIDSANFGIDFLRYGRKILKQDRSIFKYTDPDTLQSDVEYPIEMPANQGRIIGEIHLDHVPVTWRHHARTRCVQGMTTLRQLLCPLLHGGTSSGSSRIAVDLSEIAIGETIKFAMPPPPPQLNPRTMPLNSRGVGALGAFTTAETTFGSARKDITASAGPCERGDQRPLESGGEEKVLRELAAVSFRVCCCDSCKDATCALERVDLSRPKIVGWYCEGSGVQWGCSRNLYSHVVPTTGGNLP